jgi:hypothetical protein
LRQRRRWASRRGQARATLPLLPLLAEPLPELLLSAETEALTEPGRFTEASDPPVPWVVISEAVSQVR